MCICVQWACGLGGTVSQGQLLRQIQWVSGLAGAVPGTEGLAGTVGLFPSTAHEKLRGHFHQHESASTSNSKQGCSTSTRLRVQCAIVHMQYTDVQKVRCLPVIIRHSPYHPFGTKLICELQYTDVQKVRCLHVSICHLPYHSIGTKLK
eukprot:1156331-Pelagomonas_calceolata.AAC.2